jgi:hypothetical protein
MNYSIFGPADWRGGGVNLETAKSVKSLKKPQEGSRQNLFESIHQIEHIFGFSYLSMNRRAQIFD